MCCGCVSLIGDGSGGADVCVVVVCYSCVDVCVVVVCCGCVSLIGDGSGGVDVCCGCVL